jgi:SAM-dependent methyltransferase
MTRRLLELGLAERVATLTLSDVSPSFLLATVERLAPLLARGPWRVERRRLDFTRPWAEQGIPPGSVDVIAATNALHNGSDLMVALRELRGALAPDGFLVVSESLCGSGRHVHQDLIFNLLPLAPLSPLASVAPLAPLARLADARAGARSRFLTRARWADLLAGAGFAADVAANRRGPELALLAIARPAPGAGDGPARPDPRPAGAAA